MSNPEKRYPRSSSFYTYTNCDASFELSQASGEEPSTPYAEKGTRVHRVLANNELKGSLDDAEIALAADLEVQYKKFLASWLDGAPVEFELVEQRLWMRKGLKPLYSGQPDRVVFSQGRLLIPDFKTGWHPLDHIVATNAQLRSYVPLAVAYCHENDKGPIQEVTAAIHKPGKKSPPAVFDVEAMVDAERWALDVVERITRPGPKKPNRGPWCTYCSGKVLCPLWRDEIAITAQYYELAVRDIPDTVLRELAPNLSIAATVIEKLQNRLESRVKEAPENFPDWRFEKGENRRSIVNAAAAGHRLVESNHLTREEFMACCKVGITNLELAIRKRGNLSVSAAKEVINNRIGDLIDIKPMKDKLVYDPKPKELADATNDESSQAA